MQDLSDRLENEILAQCIRTAPELGCLFRDPFRFPMDLRKGFSESELSPQLAVLFDGRSEVLYRKLDRLLRRRYEDNTGDDYLKISFVLGGSCTPAT